MRIFGDSNCWGGSFFHLGTGWVFNTTSTFVWLCVCSYLFWQLSTFTFNSVLIKHALFGLKTWLFCMFSRFCSDHSVALIILQLCLPFHHVSSCTVRLYVWHIPPQMWKKVSSDRHFACLYRAVLIFPDTMVIWPSPMIPNLGVCVYITLLFWGWS